MLLHNPFQCPSNSSVKLMDWDRAPLNLTDTTKVHIELPRRPTDGHPVEVFISPFSPERWGDLWQLELVLSEKCGLLERLCAFLRDHGVIPLVAETSSFDCGEQHKVVILCDCRFYAGNKLDLNWEGRAKRERMELLELQAAITTELIEDVVFANGIDPDISLKRNASHHRAFQRMKLRRRDPETAAIDRGRIKFSSTLIKWIEDVAKARFTDMRYLVVSDSTERVLRVFLTTDLQVVHLRGSLQGRTEEVLAAALSALKERGFDVLSSRLRFGLSELASSPERERWRTIDLFLRTNAALAVKCREHMPSILEGVMSDVNRDTGEHLVLRDYDTKATHRRYSSKRTPRQTAVFDSGAEHRQTER